MLKEQVYKALLRGYNVILPGLIILGCVKLCSMIMLLFSLAITVLITCNVMFCTAKMTITGFRVQITYLKTVMC